MARPAQQPRARLWARAALGVALSAVLFACTPVYRSHGYVPTDEQLAEIKVGTSTREDVADLVGQPQAGGVLEDSAWFYVQSRWRDYGARAPQEIERSVLAISFDDRNRVANIERFGLEDGRIVTLSRRVTESSVRGQSVLQQLLANLGNFNAGQFID